jgi:hypothetical protein
MFVLIGSRVDRFQRRFGILGVEGDSGRELTTRLRCGKSLILELVHECLSLDDQRLQGFEYATKAGLRS